MTAGSTLEDPVGTCCTVPVPVGGRTAVDETIKRVHGVGVEPPRDAPGWNPHPMIGPGFAEVLAAAQAGEEAPAAVLWRELQPRLLRYLRAVEPQAAEDIASEVWLEVARGLARFRGEEPDFSAWLFTIARNRARSYLTWRATHSKATEEASREAHLVEDHVPAASHVLEKEAELRAVRDVIDGLREGPEKETVRLFYLEGTLSAREIALRMGVGKSAVTMRLERFRARIRAQLAERLAG